MFQLMCKESDRSLVSMLTVEQDQESKSDIDIHSDLENVLPTEKIKVLFCQVKIEPLELPDESLNLDVNVLEEKLTNQKEISLERLEPNSNAEPVPVAVEKRKRGRPRKRPLSPEHEPRIKRKQKPSKKTGPVKNSAEIPIPDHAKVRKANKIGKRCCCRDCRLGFTKAVSLNGDSKKPKMMNQDTAFSKENQTESVEETPDEEKEETPTKAHSLAEFIESWNEWNDESEVQEQAGEISDHIDH